MDPIDMGITTAPTTQRASFGPAWPALPVTAVTCLEDRAQVERVARIDLVTGVQRLRMGPVTPLAVDRSLRAEVVPHTSVPGTVPPGVPPRSQAQEQVAGTGADNTGDPDGGVPTVRIVDARVIRAYAPALPHGPSEEASQLRREVHALEREMREAGLLRQRLESRLAVITQAKADLHRDIVECAGAGDADPERWADRLERIEEEAGPHATRLHALRRRMRDLQEELAEARQVLLRTEREPTELMASIEVVVEAEYAGPAELRVLHLVPCALWRPAYRATLTDDGRSVNVETDATVWQCTGEDWDKVRLSLSTARPTLASSPPALIEDVVVLRDKSAQERRVVEVDFREEEVHTTGGESPMRPDASGGELPGLDDGGEVRVMAAPAPVTVICDGRPHRVPLSSFTVPCQAERVCAPELSPLVTHVAVGANTSERVLLAGPVDLVRDSGFVGRAELRFTGAGEKLRLPFGSEDDYRVVRHVEETREALGLTGINNRTLIRRTVRLFVSRLDSRAGAQPETVMLRERVPVSEVSAVEVRVKENACRPRPEEIDTEGMVRYVLQLAPGEHQEIELVYEITASGAVVGV